MLEREKAPYASNCGSSWHGSNYTEFVKDVNDNSSDATKPALSYTSSVSLIFTLYHIYPYALLKRYSHLIHPTTQYF